MIYFEENQLKTLDFEGSSIKQVWYEDKLVWPDSVSSNFLNVSPLAISFSAEGNKIKGNGVFQIESSHTGTIQILNQNNMNWLTSQKTTFQAGSDSDVMSTNAFEGNTDRQATIRFTNTAGNIVNRTVTQLAGAPIVLMEGDVSALGTEGGIRRIYFESNLKGLSILASEGFVELSDDFIITQVANNVPFQSSNLFDVEINSNPGASGRYAGYFDLVFSQNSTSEARTISIELSTIGGESPSAVIQIEQDGGEPEPERELVLNILNDDNGDEFSIFVADGGVKRIYFESTLPGLHIAYSGEIEISDIEEFTITSITTGASFDSSNYFDTDINGDPGASGLYQGYFDVVAGPSDSSETKTSSFTLSNLSGGSPSVSFDLSQSGFFLNVSPASMTFDADGTIGDGESGANTFSIQSSHSGTIQLIQ
jgi:hypothetical protein